MIRVHMKKIENIEGKKDSEVLIRVTMNAPTIGAESFIGVFFKSVPQVVLSETIVSFADMKKIMDQHNLKKWSDVKEHIEEKYTEYFTSVYHPEHKE